MDYPVYTLLFRLLLPAIVARLWIKSIREPGYRTHMAERFGRVRPHDPDPVWIHGVSVGEIQAAAPLVDHYRRAGRSLLVTVTTAAGRQTAETLYSGIATVAWLPYDDPVFIARFLTGYRPVLALIMETELWPNLIRGCRRAAIPTWIVNARLSPRSTKRYRKIGSIMQSMFADLTGIVAQSQSDFDRFASLEPSCPLFLSGNLKFDRLPDDRLIELGETWRKRVGSRPVVVFASSRDGEETLFLDAIAPLVSRNALIAIVPRHPSRFDVVFDLVASKGFACRRRSVAAERAFEAVEESVVWLGDSLGEMTAYYRLADVAIIGGSWLPHGGQSPLEAIAVGVPVIVGPHTEHFADIVAEGASLGAIAVCENLKRAVETAIEILDTPSSRQRQIEAEQVFYSQHRGALSRLLAIIIADLSSHRSDASDWRS